MRASTDPGELDLPEDLDLFGDDTAQRGLAWLSAVWQREEVRAALGEASPALSRQIDAMVALGSRDASRVRRAVISLASSVLRWQQRPTPFGLFAGLSAIHKELSTDSPAVAPRSAVTERMRALSEAADVPLVVDTMWGPWSAPVQEGCGRCTGEDALAGG